MGQRLQSLAALPMSPLSPAHTSRTAAAASASPCFRPSSLSAHNVVAYEGGNSASGDWRALQQLQLPGSALCSPLHVSTAAPAAVGFSPFGNNGAGSGSGGSGSGFGSSRSGSVSTIGEVASSLSPAGSELTLTPRSEVTSATTDTSTHSVQAAQQPHQQQQAQQVSNMMAMMAPPSPLILGRPGSSSGGRHGMGVSGPFVISSSGQAVTFNATAANVGARAGQVVPLEPDVSDEQQEEEDSFLREAFATAATQLAQLTLQQAQLQH